MGQQGTCEPLLAFRRRVKSVRLEKALVQSERTDELGHQGGALLFGHSGEDPGKLPGVVGTVVCWDIHARKENLSAGCPPEAHDLPEIGLGGRGRLAAESIVGPEFDNQDIGFLLQDPLDPGQPAGGGVAADAGVDDRDVETPVAEKGLDHRGQGVGFGQSEPGSQTVAEDDDADGGLVLDRRRRHRLRWFHRRGSRIATTRNRPGEGEGENDGGRECVPAPW